MKPLRPHRTRSRLGRRCGDESESRRGAIVRRDCYVISSLRIRQAARCASARRWPGYQDSASNGTPWQRCHTRLATHCPQVSESHICCTSHIKGNRQVPGCVSTRDRLLVKAPFRVEAAWKDKCELPVVGHLSRQCVPSTPIVISRTP